MPADELRECPEFDAWWGEMSAGFPSWDKQTRSLYRSWALSGWSARRALPAEVREVLEGVLALLIECHPDLPGPNAYDVAITRARAVLDRYKEARDGE